MSGAELSAALLESAAKDAAARRAMAIEEQALAVKVAARSAFDESPNDANALAFAEAVMAFARAFALTSRLGAEAKEYKSRLRRRVDDDASRLAAGELL